MKKLMLSVLFFLFLAASCTKKSSGPDPDTVEYFMAYLKPDMNYSALQNTFGNPDSDKGSGIHIYVYNLSDSTSIWIGYTDHIMYARHVDSNNQLIKVII